MITPEQFVAQWGTQGLVRVDSETVTPLNVPVESKQFLIEAGLPKKAEPRVTLYAPPDLLASLPQMFQEDDIDFPQEFGGYRVLADDTAFFLCLDEHRDGVIVAVDPYQEEPTRFVNTAVPQVAESLLAYRALPGPDQAAGANKETLRGWLEELRGHLRRIDPQALQDDNSWWSVILEQLEVFTR
jgi:hypothetical protein